MEQKSPIKHSNIFWGRSLSNNPDQTCHLFKQEESLRFWRAVERFPILKNVEITQNLELYCEVKAIKWAWFSLWAGTCSSARHTCYRRLCVQWTHSVGGRPLHKARAPSRRVIFTKASCSDDRCTRQYETLAIRWTRNKSVSSSQKHTDPGHETIKV